MTGGQPYAPALAGAPLALLASLPTALVYEAAGKQGDMSPAIRTMLPGTRMAGPAFTVKAWPGDNLAVFHAIAAAPAGSVLVIDAGGSDRCTIWGGSSALAAQAKGLAGCVVNAAIRDLDEIRAIGLPVFALGTSVRGAMRRHPGWLGVTLSVGDVPVRPGDIVLGDSDGVMVVPIARAAAVAAAALARQTADMARDERLRRGESIMAVLGISPLSAREPEDGTDHY